LHKKFADGSVNAEGGDAVLTPLPAHQPAQAEK
jgi:hypothetical protein